MRAMLRKLIQWAMREEVVVMPDVVIPPEKPNGKYLTMEEFWEQRNKFDNKDYWLKEYEDIEVVKYGGCGVNPPQVRHLAFCAHFPEERAVGDIRLSRFYAMARAHWEKEQGEKK